MPSSSMILLVASLSVASALVIRPFGHTDKNGDYISNTAKAAQEKKEEQGLAKPMVGLQNKMWDLSKAFSGAKKSGDAATSNRLQAEFFSVCEPTSSKLIADAKGNVAVINQLKRDNCKHMTEASCAQGGYPLDCDLPWYKKTCNFAYSATAKWMRSKNGARSSCNDLWFHLVDENTVGGESTAIKSPYR